MPPLQEARLVPGKPPAGMQILTKVEDAYCFAPRADGAPASKQDVWLSVYNAIHSDPGRKAEILRALDASGGCETQRCMTHRALHRWNEWEARHSR